MTVAGPSGVVSGRASIDLPAPPGSPPMSGLRSMLASPTGGVIIILLALAFAFSLALFIKHLIEAQHIEYQTAAELMLVAVLSLEGIVAVAHLRQSRLDSLQVLIEVHQDFRSAEMMLAIVTLWRFRRD